MGRSSWSRFGAKAVAIASSWLWLAEPAAAHPHVWVTVQATVLYEGQRITGIEHTWTFDDMYTAMAVQGLDKDGDGTYSREELAELAKINIDGLKEYNYFTVAKLGTSVLKVKEPTSYWLEYKKDLLSLHFVMPFEEPLLADAEGFNFSVYDETFFIAFDMAQENPVRLGEGAPQGCTASVGIPQNELDQLQALNQSFGGQLTAGDQNMGMGAGYAKTVTVGCKRS